VKFFKDLCGRSPLPHHGVDLFFHAAGDLVIPVVVMFEESPKPKILATLVFSNLAEGP